MKRIVCFHLLNDYSGSPKVLAMVLEGLLEKGYCVELVTSKHGVLNDLRDKQGIRFHTYFYHFSKNPFVTLVLYLYSQVYTFFFSFKFLFKKDVVFYINTILPVAPAFAGKLIGKKVVYHYHENAFIKSKFYRILASIMEKIADEVICVSEYQRGFLSRKERVTVIPNSLPVSFTEAFETDSVKPTLSTVLMLSSLKVYKGLVEFAVLAKALPIISFELVVNANKEDIEAFWLEQGVMPPKNMTVYSRQTNTVPFYKRASLVLNLSNKNKFLETFGLTALEAFTAGVPVIVPTEGGIAELVVDGWNGFKIDVQDLDKIENKIRILSTNTELYRKLSINAEKISLRYSYKSMIERVSSLL